MKKLFIVLIMLTSLAACSVNQSFEDFFHERMERHAKEYEPEVKYAYSLVHHEENVVTDHDAVAIITEHNLQGDQIFIAYIKKENGVWEWKQTRGAEWGTPVQWSAMHQEPYIFSGAISDPTIQQVHVGGKQANIIDVADGKRFWYEISSEPSQEVKVTRADGSEEVLEEIDEEMLKDWEGKDGE
ncbi:hypothetical protein [Bacillus sp. KH172YL63]|uniref:hypothetical protein n=1 Tax=Bacillus sp. KH172YL63 TaxID=2709784 RepID=UPI0013E41D05|nr:hypothetical protein [Bacillus sp. KH172YL63]BCB04058.1 hypothetical protein KH172YL63_21910 [Bacillus sp. KH172YL63]